MDGWDWAGLRSWGAPARRPEPGGMSFADLEALAYAQADHIEALRTIIELAPVGIGIVDMEGRTPLTNDALRLLLGYSEDEFAQLTFSDFSHADDNAENMRLFERMRRGELDRFAMEKRFFRKDGGVVRTSLTVSLIRGADGRPAYAIGMTQDITEQHRLEVERRAAEARLRLLVDRVPAVVYTTELGRPGRWHYVSPQIETLLGWTPQEWIARPELWWDAVVPQHRELVQVAEEELLRGTRDTPVSRSYRLIHRDGRVIWVRDDGLAAPGPDGQVLVHGVLVDITEQKVLEEALAEQAVHDALTGLWNRLYFRRSADAALADRSVPVGLLFVDLDGFKEVNDTCGHRLGDVVLSTVAARLAGCVRDGEVLARLGGDEFALLLLDATEDRLRTVGERMLATLAEPIGTEGTLVRVGASIGAALAGPDDTTDTLLHQADQAMYRAKSAGGHRVELATAPTYARSTTDGGTGDEQS